MAKAAKTTNPETLTEQDAPAPKAQRVTKQQIMIDMLSRPEGTTIEELVEATGWLSHTCRGAMSGALKKKLGLTITSKKDDPRGRVYRLEK
jgi:hypothetical protein